MSPFGCQFGYAPPMFPDQEADMGVRVTPTRDGDQRRLIGRDSGFGYRPRTCLCMVILAPRYIRPFKVLRHINPVSYRVALTLSLQVHPTFHVSCLKPILLFGGPLRPARSTHGALAYMVKHLLDVWWVHVGVHSLVDWERYGPEEWSWVSSRHSLDRELICTFQRDCAAGLGMSGATPSGGVL
ncbi:hypothetical protein P4O66_013587 [Electrophorus voltai]|uniref:Tf2-1-like SH3-like domain-containing protein n=1 Tax=Electrophorus voltai TaxID=2609070 RepID=A0AAD8Z209_9TELE|nr:hypothetical protein P4O66_013587 [Electrophorus voltai]